MAREDVFKVTVDYSRSLAEMIASGKYSWVHSEITEKHFPLPKIPAGVSAKLDLNLELVHVKRYISSNDAIAELKRRGMRPTIPPELLAFGKKYPEEQRKSPIVALGSVWRHWGGGRVPCLWGVANGRYMDLDWYGDDWNGYYRFLAVCES